MARICAIQFGGTVPDSGSLNRLEATAPETKRGCEITIAAEKLATALDAPPFTEIAYLSSYQLTEWVTL